MLPFYYQYCNQNTNDLLQVIAFAHLFVNCLYIYKKVSAVIFILYIWSRLFLSEVAFAVLNHHTLFPMLENFHACLHILSQWFSSTRCYGRSRTSVLACEEVDISVIILVLALEWYAHYGCKHFYASLGDALQCCICI